MTTASMNIFIRVINRRIDDGELLDEILATYPRLSNEDKDEIKRSVNESDEDIIE